MKPFADQVVVITGASGGIGAELARQLASQGAWLALAARRAHELDLVAQDCIARGGRALVVPTDVSDPAQCDRLIAHTMESYGRIDVLVNNAGVGAHFRFEDATDLGVYERVMRVNYLGSVYMTHSALPALKASRGRIVAISSLAGMTGVPNRTAYAASKHAMIGFFESLRIELDGTGVAVTIICPGFVQTDIRKNALGADGKPLGESHLRESEVMLVDECVRQSLRAVAHRHRDLVMTPHWTATAIAKVVAPEVVDRIALRAIQQGASSEEGGASGKG